MNRATKGYLFLVAGALLIASPVLYNSLSGGERSISHLIQTYPLPLALGLLCFGVFFWLTKKDREN